MEWGENYGPTTDHAGRTRRTSTVNRGHWRSVVHAPQPWRPDLGVKGSRVQAREAWDSLSLWKYAMQAASQEMTARPAGKP
jgi:hypothetical protein